MGLLHDADSIISGFRNNPPVGSAPPPRPVTSAACQTHEIPKAEADAPIVPQIKIPGPPGDVTITAKDHMVYIGAMANVKRLIRTTTQLKTELSQSREETIVSEESHHETAQLTAECDALRQLRDKTEERHEKELALAARVGRMFSEYHTTNYGRVVAEMVSIEDLGVRAEDYPEAETYKTFVARARASDEDPSA